MAVCVCRYNLKPRYPNLSQHTFGALVQIGTGYKIYLKYINCCSNTSITGFRHRFRLLFVARMERYFMVFRVLNQ